MDDGFDYDDLEKKLHTKYSDQKIDIIACDFNLDHDKINGIEIACMLRQFNRNSSILIYSGNLAGILRIYFADFKEDNPKPTLTKIKKLITSKIEDFVDRPDYVDRIVGLTNNNTIELEIEDSLLKYKDYTFKHGLTKIRGKKFSEIANEIGITSPLGRKFIKDLIERALAHMIELNTQDE